MQVKSHVPSPFAFARELVNEHFCQKLPLNFLEELGKEQVPFSSSPTSPPALYTAHLPGVLDWLHGLEDPRILEEKPCVIPLLLYDKTPSTKKILFHYEGHPESSHLIRQFIELFARNIKGSSATIISPCFIPKSKLKEEQELIQLVRDAVAETSFIKFNFNRIGDFWSYAVKHQSNLLVTTKNHQAELAKLLFHFYKGGMWYDRLSFYLGV